MGRKPIEGGDPMYARPNTGELKQLSIANTGSVIRSNLFDLQMKQVLDATRVCYSKHDAVKQHLHRINQVTQAIDDHMVSEGCLDMQGIKLINHIKRKEILLSFKKPSRMDLIGSYVTQTGSKVDFNIDVAVEIPSDCFVPKDFLNFRYMDKRALYLGVLASKLSEDRESFSSVRVASFNGDSRKPILVLEPKYEVKSKYGKCAAIRVIPVIDHSVFQSSKLLPTRANVKNPQQSDNVMTPHYNNSIVQDMRMVQHMRELHKVVRSCPQFADAIMLGKLWARQKGFDRMHGSVNGFMISMFLLFLMDQSLINMEMSSDQIFKVLMNFLANDTRSGAVFRFTTAEDAEQLATSDLESVFPMSMIDSSGLYNLTSNLTRAAIVELQRESQKTIRLLHEGTMEGFQQIFVEKCSFYHRYDEYVQIPCPSMKSVENIYTVDERSRICDAGLENFWVEQLESLAAKALTDRAFMVRSIVVDPPASWCLHLDRPSPKNLMIGILINPEEAGRAVDKGPAADDAVLAKEFRAFWGEKSELRRFKDGSIVEAVVWDQPSHEKYRIVSEIVRYIISMHFGRIKLRSINAALPQFYETLNDCGLPFADPTLNLWKAFNSVSETLRNLETLPLKITSVQPASGSFRYTSRSAPVANPWAYNEGENLTRKASGTSDAVSTVLEPREVIFELEKSSKWPSDRLALQNTKIGFYVQMAEELMEQGLRCQVSRNFVDVFTQGHVFRMSIACERERSLEKDNSKLCELQKQQIYRSQHTTLIHSLQMKYPTFGPTVRLARQWLSDKFLSNHLRLEAVELIVASIFLEEASSKGSIMASFMRFLRLIFKFDWENVPLIVDLNQNLTSKDKNDIRQEFLILRKHRTLPQGNLYIVSDYEMRNNRSSWTQESPSSPVLQKMKVEAAHSYKCLQNWLSKGMTTTNGTWKSTFGLEINAFDLIIELEPEFIPSVSFKKTYYRNTKAKAQVYVDFDPVEMYCSRLESEFGHLAFFFRSEDHPDRVLVLWKPPAFLPRKLNPYECKWMYPIEIEGKLNGLPAIPVIFAEMKRLGCGIVSSLHVI